MVALLFGISFFFILYIGALAYVIGNAIDKNNDKLDDIYRKLKWIYPDPDVRGKP